ncbi:MAG: 4-hydroxy-tetrahydrodipicolinate reductase [Clostridiales bacterium]|nr:4-hydroxy-tetrahydrodipicolinate reductase [Clostridiales bacterium]
MKILISGALGFMGREVARQAAEQGIEVACGVDIVAGKADYPLYTTFEDCPAVDVIVDFSTWKPGADLLTWAVKNRVPAVIATTGLSEEQLAAIDEAAKVIPIFRSGNMSLGIALLRALAKKAASVLGESFDIEIVEAHHNRKADAPSGTALMLLDAVKEGCESEREAKFGRHGRDAKRQKQEIGVHALRGGTVTGEHEVCFFGTSERIRVSHSAENRSVFAAGALRAAEFLASQKPGLYSMDDVVGKL